MVGNKSEMEMKLSVTEFAIIYAERVCAFMLLCTEKLPAKCTMHPQLEISRGLYYFPDHIWITYYGHI